MLIRGNKRKDFRKTTHTSLFRFADNIDKLLMVAGSLFAIGVIVVQVLYLLSYKDVVNAFVTQGKSIYYNVSMNDTQYMIKKIDSAIKLFTAAGVGCFFAVFLSTFCWACAADRQIIKLRHTLFRSVLIQEMAWFDTIQIGNLINVINDDIETIRCGIGERFADFFLLLSKAAGGIIMAFLIGWKMACVFAAFMPLIIFSLVALMRTISKFAMLEVRACSQASHIAKEVFSNIQTVMAFGGQKYDVKRFGENLEVARNVGAKKGLHIGLCQMSTNLFLYACFAALVWLGPYLIRREPHLYNPGIVMLVFFGLHSATFCFGNLTPNLQYVAEARASASKAYSIIDRVSNLNPLSETGKKPKSVAGRIIFENVSFSYPTREKSGILRKLNVEIPAGSTIAFVGSSGCGKSTLAKLILRLYDCDEGKVLVDEIDVKDWNLKWLRSQTAIVCQEPLLFHGTIRENILIGKEDASNHEMLEASKIANAHDFISCLPDGYNTIIGERGTMLSGGQKQRIAIARALISKPRILILDEATSALDMVSERKVQRSLERAKATRTTIVIAHRLSTIQNADLICVMDKGEIIEKGNHDTLMQLKGVYHDLYTAQKYGDDITESISPFVKQTNKSISEDLSQTSSEESSSDYEAATVQNGSVPVVYKISEPRVRHCKSSILKRFLQRQIEDLKIFFKVLRCNFAEWYLVVFGLTFIVVRAVSKPLFTIVFTGLYGLFVLPNELQKPEATRLALMIFGIGLVYGVSSFITTYCFEKSASHLINRMRTWLFTSMIYQDMVWFSYEENRVAALLKHLFTDTAQLKGLSGQRLAVILQSVLSIGISVATAFYYSWRLSIVVFSALPLIVFAGYVQGAARQKNENPKKFRRKKKGFSAEVEARKLVSDVLNSIKYIISVAKEEYFLNRYKNLFHHELRKRIIHNIKFALGYALAQSVEYFLYSITFGFGARLVAAGALPFHLVFRIEGLVGLLGMSLGRKSAFLLDFRKARDCASAIFQLMKIKPRIDVRDKTGDVIKDIKGEIVFKGVKFEYSARAGNSVLNNFTVSIPPNKTCALVGKSGSGKSTVLSLLLRFYDPDEGSVTLDGYEIETLNVEWLRSKIGFVQQEPILFDISIKQNILYGMMEQISEADVIDVCKKANIHEDIMNLPMGYDTVAGSDGNLLSGGQKQRIAIARALIRNPKILLLDEATSALDSTCEKIIQNSILKENDNRTLVAVAHRLSTIRHASEIFVIDNGRIIEKGNHEELLSRNGTYALLWHFQDAHHA